jgi:hypothetical protein
MKKRRALEMYEVKKIYWITHPAYSLHGILKAASTPKQIGLLIRENIMPNAVKAAREKEQGSIVTLVKTPPYELLVENLRKAIMRDETGWEEADRLARSLIRPEVHAQIEKIEGALEAELSKLLKGRAIIIDGCAIKEAAAYKLGEALREKRFILAPRVVQKGLGSFREWCSTEYPKEFKAQMRFEGPLVVPKRGNLAFAAPESVLRFTTQQRRR